MTTDVVKISDYANTLIRKNIFTRRRINKLLHDWCYLTMEYKLHNQKSLYEEAYSSAKTLNRLAQEEIFIKAPHHAISYMLLGEQAYNLDKPFLAAEHLTSAKELIRIHLSEFPIFYISLLIEIGDLEACHLNLYEAEKTFQGAHNNFVSFDLKLTEDYLLLLNHLVEINCALCQHIKVDFYMDELRTVKIPYWEKYKSDNNLGDIHNFNLLAYQKYSYSLIMRGMYSEAVDILNKIEFCFQSLDVHEDVKNEIRIKLIHARSKL